MSLPVEPNKKTEDTLGESLLWRGVGAGLDRTEQEQGQGQSQGRARAGPEKAQSRFWTAKEGSGEAQQKAPLTRGLDKNIGREREWQVQQQKAGTCATDKGLSKKPAAWGRVKDSPGEGQKCSTDKVFSKKWSKRAMRQVRQQKAETCAADEGLS